MAEATEEKGEAGKWEMKLLTPFYSVPALKIHFFAIKDLPK